MMLSSFHQSRSLVRTVRKCQLRALSTAAEEEGESIIQLYQYAICPFCNKTKAVLDYANVQYNTVEVNPLTKAEIRWSKDYRKVPIATYNDQVWKGSDVITRGILSLDDVQGNLTKKWQGTDMTVDDFRNDADDEFWVSFTNDKLASLLYPNICANYADSYAAFGYVQHVKSFSWFQKQSIRAIGALAMYMAASKVKKRMGITDERQALDKSLVEIEDALQSKSFLSGRDEPGLGDLAVYGALRSIEGLPAHDRIMFHDENTDRPLRLWYDRTKSKVTGD